MILTGERMIAKNKITTPTEYKHGKKEQDQKLCISN